MKPDTSTQNLLAVTPLLDFQHPALQQLIDERALLMAKDIVLRTHQTMKLEGQAVSDERLKAAIEEKASELRREMPKQLWD